MAQVDKNVSSDKDTQETSKHKFNFNFKSIIKKKIPISEWLPRYTLVTFFQDLLAGVTVALTEIPQAIAYADVASLPTEYGLYSGFVGGFVYSVFGSCKDINIGPTSIMALMLQPHVSKLGNNMAVFMTFVAGVIIFLFGVLNLGFVIEFFSYPIIAGFTCAASLQIGSSQIKSFLGITGKADVFLEAWETVFKNIDKTSKWDAILGILSLILLIALREIRRFGSLQDRPEWSRKRNIFGKMIFMISLARNALVVLIGSLISYGLRDNNPFQITKKVKSGFPPFQLPPFSSSINGTDYDFNDITKDFGTSLIFIPLVAILEAVSIAKTFSKGRPLDATQEMLALGLSNIVGSFVSSMPVTGSFTRTAVNNASGVKTTIAGVVTSLIVLLSIAFLTPSFHYIPKSTLAAVIICAMLYLFDYRAFVLIWRSKKLDYVPFLTTFLCCTFISLETGILIGIGVNLLFVLYASARPKLNFTEEKITDCDYKVYVITPQDTLYFPAAEHVRDVVLAWEGQDVVAVVNGTNIRNMDVTVAKTLAVLIKEVVLKKQMIFFLNFKESVIDICLGIDKKLKDHFVTGSLEDVLKVKIN